MEIEEEGLYESTGKKISKEQVLCALNIWLPTRKGFLKERIT